jgi:hypothetical protein
MNHNRIFSELTNAFVVEISTSRSRAPCFRTMKARMRNQEKCTVRKRVHVCVEGSTGKSLCNYFNRCICFKCQTCNVPICTIILIEKIFWPIAGKQEKKQFNFLDCTKFVNIFVAAMTTEPNVRFLLDVSCRRTIFTGLF